MKEISLIEAYEILLEGVTEYVEYEYSGDPYEEDARAMGEMCLDEISKDQLKGFRAILDAAKIKLTSQEN